MTYTVDHVVYYDPLIECVVCRNAQTGRVDFTREGNVPLDVAVRSMFEGYQIVRQTQDDSGIHVQTLHHRIDIEA